MNEEALAAIIMLLGLLVFIACLYTILGFLLRNCEFIPVKGRLGYFKWVKAPEGKGSGELL